MIVNRIAASVATIFLLSAGAALADDPTAWIRSSLQDATGRYESCTAERASIEGTISRTSGLELPQEGKVLVVNIPSGVVTAYQDGVPVIESRAVVGKPSTPTPEMDTHVTFVRPNPTWTVPASIIRKNGWAKKLETNPGFFEDNNFEVITDGGRMSPINASKSGAEVKGFIQLPGKGNALGTLKIGIKNDQSIYLHDTNDPKKFNAEVRAASAGCVRIKKVEDIAAWILDTSTENVAKMIDDGDTDNHTPPAPVRVILGYWTAWPDAQGKIRFYPDIYSKDPMCGTREAKSEEPSSTEESKTPPPRFIPGNGADPAEGNNAPSGIWTEYEATR